MPVPLAFSLLALARAPRRLPFSGWLSQALAEPPAVPRKPQEAQVAAADRAVAPAAPLKWSRRLLRILAAFAAVSIGGAAVWHGGLKYRFVPKRFGVVVPGKVYRSGQITKWLIDDTISRHGIQVIVDFTNFDWDDEHQQAELKAAWKYRLPVNRFPMGGDGTGPIDRYAEAVMIIDRCVKQNKPVLVHCAAGSSRTGVAIAYYRTLVEGRSGEFAYAELRQYDWSPADNVKLLKYVNRHMGDMAKLLVQRGVIQRVPNPLPVVASGM